MPSRLAAEQNWIAIMKYKILFVIGSLDVGGAERHLVQILPYLARSGAYEPIVFTFSRKGKLAPCLEAHGVRVIEPPFLNCLRSLPELLKKPLSLFIAMGSYVSILVRVRPAIVHFFLPAAYLLGGIGALLVGRSSLVMSRRSLNKYQENWPFCTWVEFKLHKYMAAILGNSIAVLRDLNSEGVQINRLGLLYNGIDLARYKEPLDRHATRRELGVSDNDFLITCVANLIPYKGHKDLIHALAIAKNRLPINWVAAMIGRDTGYGNDLVELAISLGVGGHIKWLGERDNIVQIYRSSDLGVLCSHQEGFSNSVLEGMAAELAMVVTDVGGNAEAVIDGKCGIVVPAKNCEAIGNAILKLTNNEELRRNMSVAGKKRVEELFSLDTCVSKYLKLYGFLIEGRRDMAVQSVLDSV